MNGAFQQTIDLWHDFYLMAGTASATLIGLLFVSVSLHVDLITDPAATGVLASARRAFISFIIIVLIALMFLVPGQSPRGLGLPLVVLALIDLGRMVNVTRVMRRERDRMAELLGTMTDYGRFGLGLASSIGLLAVSITILAGTAQYLYWLVAVIAILLVGAAENCWNLLLNLAVAKRRLASVSTSSGVAAPDVAATPETTMARTRS